MGVALTSFRQTANDDRLDTFDVAVSVLQSLPLDNLVIAGNVHYLSGNALTGGASEEVSSDSWDVDFGAMYGVGERFRAGVMVRQIRGARFRTSDDEADADRIELPTLARAGVSYGLPANTLVAFDFDLTRQGVPDDEWRELSFGVEKTFFDGRLGARAGLRAEVGSELGSRPAFSVGGRGLVWLLEIEAAYTGSSGSRDEAFWLGVTLAR